VRNLIRHALLICLCLPLVLESQQPTRVFPNDRSVGEGKMWIKWDKSQRLGFIRGYNSGLDRGYHNGCLTVYEAASPSSGELDQSKKTNRSTSGLQECMSKQPLFSKEAAHYETQITNFYETYPQDQDLPIRQFFSHLADSSSETLEQIHSWYHTP
jgi:hypothetical protein